MRTQQEILNRIEEARKRDPDGYEWEEYVFALDTDHFFSFLKEHVTKFDFSRARIDWKPTTPERLWKLANGYLSFVWDYCNGKSDFLVKRALMAYKAWFWLMGRDDFDDLMDDYRDYGRPQLERIEEVLKGKRKR